MLKEDSTQSLRGLPIKMDIPEATLRSRRNLVAKKGTFGSNNKMLLTPEEEVILKGWIIRQAQRGFGFDKAGVISFLTGFLHHDLEKEKKLEYPYNIEQYNARFNRPGIKADGDHKKWYAILILERGFQNIYQRPELP